MIVPATFDALPEEIVSVEPDMRNPRGEWAIIGVRLSCGRVHQMKARWDDLKQAGVKVAR